MIFVPVAVAVSVSVIATITALVFRLIKACNAVLSASANKVCNFETCRFFNLHFFETEIAQIFWELTVLVGFEDFIDLVQL